MKFIRFSFFVISMLTLSLLFTPSSWANPSKSKTRVQEINHPITTSSTSQHSHVKGFAGAKTTFTTEKIGKQTYYVSPIVHSNMTFSYVGLHWKTVSGLKKQQLDTISYQIRSYDGKVWSDWKTVSMDADSQDKTSSEIFADLIYTKKGVSVQYRITSSDNQNLLSIIGEIQLTLLNTDNGPIHKKKPPIANKPNVVTREEWGADESLRYKNQDQKQGLKESQRYSKVSHLVVHHTGENLLPGQSPEGYLRAVYYYHTVTRGWADIGYNALIGPDGTIYEGRKGFSKNPHIILNDGVVGAHAKGFNTGSFGVSLIGNFEEKPLPQLMRNSLVQLLAYEADFWNIDPTGSSDFKRSGDYDKSKYTPVDQNIPTITGHGLLKYNDTDCPGKYVKSELEQIKLDVKKEFNWTQN